MGYSLNYDWAKIEGELISNNILNKYKEKRTQISIGRIDEIVDFWLIRLKNNPFYFLKDETKTWVESNFKKLNRPFQITDFE